MVLRGARVGGVCASPRTHAGPAGSAHHRDGVAACPPCFPGPLRRTRQAPAQAALARTFLNFRARPVSFLAASFLPADAMVVVCGGGDAAGEGCTEPRGVANPRAGSFEGAGPSAVPEFKCRARVETKPKARQVRGPFLRIPRTSLDRWTSHGDTTFSRFTCRPSRRVAIYATARAHPRSRRFGSPVDLRAPRTIAQRPPRGPRRPGRCAPRRSRWHWRRCLPRRAAAPARRTTIVSTQRGGLATVLRFGGHSATGGWVDAMRAAGAPGLPPGSLPARAGQMAQPRRSWRGGGFLPSRGDARCGAPGMGPVRAPHRGT